MAKQMVRYRFMPHTADVKFMAYGRTMAELFQNAALAMFDTIADTTAMRGSNERGSAFKVSVVADNQEDLLWKTLQRCLSVSNARGLFCYGLARPRLKEGKTLSFSAIALTKKGREGISRLEVKGVSKYSLGVEKREKGFRCTVVVDV